MCVCVFFFLVCSLSGSSNLYHSLLKECLISKTDSYQFSYYSCNNIGDPEAIAKVPGGKAIKHLDNWASSENLQLLNLM